MVSAVALVLAFPCLLLILSGRFPLAWAWVFLAEFFLFFNTGPSNTALANATRPQVRATAFAVNILVIHSFGDAISPTVIGWLADHSGGDLRVGFTVVGAVMLVGAAAWFIGARYLDRDTDRVLEATA
jgi:predicted MFS family arabinose efflux permease